MVITFPSPTSIKWNSSLLPLHQVYTWHAGKWESVGSHLPSTLQILLSSLGTWVKQSWSWHLAPVVDLKLQGWQAGCSLLWIKGHFRFGLCAGTVLPTCMKVSGRRGAHQRCVCKQRGPSILPYNHSQLALQHQQAKLGGPRCLPMKINPNGMGCLAMAGEKVSSRCKFWNSDAPPALCKQWCLKC